MGFNAPLPTPPRFPSCLSSDCGCACGIGGAGTTARASQFVASLIFLAAVAPWVWRCSETYGRLVAFRSNFGLEILVGNSPDTSNPFNWSVLLRRTGSSNQSELEKVMRVGEPAYLAEKDHEASELVEQHPFRFAFLTLRRIVYTWTVFWNFSPRAWTDDSGLPNILMYSLISLLAWTGLVRAIYDGRDGVSPLAILVVCYPLVYYFTHPEIRFRQPIDPVIVILLVYGVMSFRGIAAQLAPRRRYGEHSTRPTMPSGSRCFEKWLERA